MHITKSWSVPADVSIIIPSLDTDVFVLLLSFIEHVEQKVLFDTGNKRWWINVQALFEKVGPEVCISLDSQVLTGCDTTSVFVRRFKIGVMKALKKHPS